MDKTIQEKTENLYYKTQEETTGIRYVGGDAAVQYEYFPTDFGLKENIVLKKKPEVNQFRFVLQCRGRYLEKEHRAILIRDNETKKVKGVLSEPFMTDASDGENQGFSEDAEYEQKSVEDVVLEAPAVVVADAEYSAEEKAKFDDANIPVIYVDAEDDETVITLGQIFNCNAKADEVAYVKAALEK